MRSGVGFLKSNIAICPVDEPESSVRPSVLNASDVHCGIESKRDESIDLMIDEATFSVEMHFLAL